MTRRPKGRLTRAMHPSGGPSGALETPACSSGAYAPGYHSRALRADRTVAQNSKAGRPARPGRTCGQCRKGSYNPRSKRIIAASGLPFKPHTESKKADFDAHQELYRQLAERLWSPNHIVIED